MRDIKFRAWDRDEEVMLYLDDLPAEVIFQLGRKGEFILMGEGADDDVIGLQWVDIDFELMQYTGLHDKNGKEIYESDVLSEKWKFVVEYIEDGFYCTHKQGKKVVSTPLSVMLKKREKAGDPLQIVGNIYETPELLEEK